MGKLATEFMGRGIPRKPMLYYYIEVHGYTRWCRPGQIEILSMLRIRVMC